jgi:hypothetical protein
MGCAYRVCIYLLLAERKLTFNSSVALGYEPEFGNYKRIVQFTQYATREPTFQFELN